MTVSSDITPEVVSRLKSYVYDIVGCCQEVHKELGPWLNEYMYQEALKVSFGEKQLWNYMRLTGTPIGILYNFAPVKDQCEKYYYDVEHKTISAF